MNRIEIGADLLRSREIPPFGSAGEPIYALMVTGKDPSRRMLARNSLLSFLGQTYANRHLVIINDADEEFETHGFGQNHIHQVRVGRKETLGELRNRSLDFVPADGVAVQWDDDDWHAPGLMAEQYEFMSRQKADGCSPAAQVKYVFGLNSAWEHALPANGQGFAGAVMIRQKSDVRYPALKAHEDSVFWAEFLKKYRVCRWDNDPACYIRFIHSTNTSTHFPTKERAPDEWIVSPPTDAYLKTVLPFYGVSAGQMAERKLRAGAPLISM